MKKIIKDLTYWKQNCEEDYSHTPISVLRYISELEKAVEGKESKVDLVELEEKLDKHLNKETEFSILRWLKLKRR